MQEIWLITSYGQDRNAGTPIAHTRHALVICSECAGEESIRNKLDEGGDGRRCGLHRGAVCAKLEGVSVPLWVGGLGLARRRVSEVGGVWVRLGGAAAHGCASAQPLLRAETEVTGCGRRAGWGAREEGVF